MPLPPRHTRESKCNRRRYLARATCLALLGAGVAVPALGQVCPSPASVTGTSCTVPSGTVINVTPGGAIGLSASGSTGVITADGITLNLGAATTIGGLAQQGATISFNGGALNTTSVGAAASGQIGLRATGTSSQITASNATIRLLPASGTANAVTGVVVDDGGNITLGNTTLQIGGGGNGAGNHGLQATGATITYTGGSISTLSRGSFGALAQAGGVITLDGTQITTSGAQIIATSTGSHGLLATGAGSHIGGNAVTINTSGTLASGARAEGGATLSLTSSIVTSTSAAVTDTDPSAAVRVLSGGTLTLAGAGTSITATGTRGHGLSVEGTGSQAFVSDTAIAVSGSRARGVNVFAGAAASVTNTTILATTSIGVEVTGGTLNLTATGVRATGATGYGLQALLGASVTVTGGSVATEGRDAAGLHLGGSTLTATNLTITTTGPDNAMGALSDGTSVITLTGGSVTTSGDSVRAGARPHGLAARNPGGTLISTGTTVLTRGQEAMGVVADDGGTVILTGNSIRTENRLGIALFAVAEQVGTQFPASITATGLTVESLGLAAHGVSAQARNDLPVETATITISDSSVTTRGDSAVGLRAVLGDYGTRPIAGRGEAVLIANRTTVLTLGTSSHGALARDDPASVTLNQTSILSVGPNAHGTVAEIGGRIIGTGSTVIATGSNAAALFAIGGPAPVSTAIFINSQLINANGPTIGTAGVANISLTGTIVGGSGQWLHVGTIADFPPLLQELPLTGIPDVGQPEDPPAFPTATAFPLAAQAPAVPGLATIVISGSILTGSAITAPGSISNVTLQNNTLWTLTGNSNITNLTNNASTIDFSPPVSGIFKTLTVVNYTTSLNTIGLNTFLGTDGSPSDLLIIDGGTGTGAGRLRITNAGGAGALTAANGILVISAINGATTVPGLFTLAGPVVAGPYAYTLYRGSMDASAPESWFLRSTLDCTLNPDTPACLGPSPTPPAPGPPNYRREVSLYAALPSMALQHGRALLDTLHERVGEEEQLRGRADLAGRTSVNGAWGRIIGLAGDQDGGSLYRRGPEYTYHLYAMQLGMDVYRKEDQDGHRDHAGVYGAFGRVQGKVTHFDDSRAGTDRLDGYTLGAYWTHFGPTGWYLDGVVQGTWYEARARSTDGLGLRTNGFGIAASAEGGYPFHFEDRWILEPQAQLIYQNVSLGRTGDAAASVRFDDADSLTGRLALRLAKSWSPAPQEGEPRRAMTGWLRASLWHEFLGNTRTRLSSADGYVPFRSDVGGTWLEFNAGVSGQISRTGTLYISAGYGVGLDGDRHSWNGKMGVRFNW